MDIEWIWMDMNGYEWIISLYPQNWRNKYENTEDFTDLINTNDEM